LEDFLSDFSFVEGLFEAEKISKVFYSDKAMNVADFMKQEKTREFDMFIEMFEFLDPSFNTENKKRYIDNVHKLFNSRIDFKDNKIFTLKKYSNFKFHYFDIRNLLLFNNECLVCLSFIKYMCSSLK
jgi:hypothetical protein